MAWEEVVSGPRDYCSFINVSPVCELINFDHVNCVKYHSKHLISTGIRISGVRLFSVFLLWCVYLCMQEEQCSNQCIDRSNCNPNYDGTPCARKCVSHGKYNDQIDATDHTA